MLKRYQEKVEKPLVYTLPKDISELMRRVTHGERNFGMFMAYRAHQMNRCMHKAYIILVGVSGSGKSTTINYLFNKNIARDSNTRSETNSCIEYTVTMAIDSRIPKDFQLAVVDTPGLFDTEGMDQDAANVMSVKFFHEKEMNASFPNLVLVAHDISDKRMGGENSKFVQLMHAINYMNIVDKKNPNIVIVLTFAMSIGSVKEEWTKETREKEELVSRIVQMYLGVTPRIVVQENKPTKHKLPVRREWHVLPDDEIQPWKLFETCKELLIATGDHIGLVGVSAGFLPDMTKTIEEGNKISANSINIADVNKCRDYLQSLQRKFPASEVSSLLDEYRNNKREITGIHFEINILKMKFRDLGLTESKHLQSMSLNSLVQKLKPTCITKLMEQVLKDIFGLEYTQTARFEFHVGKSFNALKDLVLPSKPIQLYYDESGIPTNILLTNCSTLDFKCELVENDEQYIRERLRDLELNVGANVNIGAFGMQIRNGYNRKNASQQRNKNQITEHSFAAEYKLKKAVLNTPYKPTDEFKSDINTLPVNFEGSNLTKQKLSLFLDKWGTHVIIGSYIGGSMTGVARVESDNLLGNSCDDAKMALAAKLSTFQNSTENSIDHTQFNDLQRNTVTNTNFVSLQWNGGEQQFYAESLDNINKQQWSKWINSLEMNPVPLSGSFELFPIYHIVSKVSQERGMVLHRAFEEELKVKTLDPNVVPTRESAATLNTTDDNCFHEDSVLVLSDGQISRMKDIKVGDKILSIDKHGKIQEDVIISWLHRLENGCYEFLEISHKFGTIRMTKDHIIYIEGNRLPRRASSLKPGQNISFFPTMKKNEVAHEVKVLSVKKVFGQGIYAPLTYGGHLIVDGIAVSCYCSLDSIQILGKEIITSQSLAHAAIFPLRMAYKFGIHDNVYKINKATGIHWYAQWLIDHVRFWL